MKFRLIALAALAATGAAHAISPADMVAAGTNLKVHYIAGASAQTPMLGAYLYSQCDTTTFDHFFKGSDHHAYSCVLKNKVGNWNIGTKILVTKRDKGGSVFGVNPIAQQTAQETLDVLTPGACTLVSGSTPTGTNANYTCTATTNQVAHAGLSDVEPAIFQLAVKVNGVANYLNLDPAANGVPLTSTELGTLNVAAVNETIFGVAVSKNLRNALQSAQGLTVGDDTAANQPSIPRAFYAAAVSGFLKGNTAGYTGWSAVTGVAADDSKAINICRRVNGSGTQAAGNLFFLDAGNLLDSTKGAIVPVSGNTTLATLNATSTLWNSNALNVIENSGTGDVETCLGNAFTAGAYAAGVISLEKDPGTKNYRFVKIDGAAPTQANARVGGYGFLYTASMQYNTKQVMDSGVLAFIKAVRTAVATPNVIAGLATPARNGVLASPSQWNVTTATCATATGNDALYGSCVERLDAASLYTYNKRVLGITTAMKTNSGQQLHLVR
jgi:hypothetical protein